MVKTLQALKTLAGPGTVETLVDNRIAVENLTRLAQSKGCTIETEQLAENRFRVTITAQAGAQLPDTADGICTVPSERPENTVVVISADHMGQGDDTLGRVLLKGFLFALTQQEKLPRTVLFYNGGAFVTCDGSASLEDLHKLEALGVEILTCGTCLNHYGIADKLRVGQVTNMYVIAEKQMNATLVIGLDPPTDSGPGDLLPGDGPGPGGGGPVRAAVSAGAHHPAAVPHFRRVRPGLEGGPQRRNRPDGGAG